MNLKYCRKMKKKATRHYKKTKKGYNACKNYRIMEKCEMTEFKYFTREKSSPQGKPRVYYTAHPNDFKKYFDEICREILKRENCAVFYLEPEVEIVENEAYEFDLQQMKIMVIPVTGKLLTTKNRTLDFDMPFAIENNIPILPLMLEDGLDTLFSKKIGDLQYLQKNNSDPTVLSFDAKLTKFLDSVIVGDELAKKVRAAFDAYIFLSYRKKDRYLAQKLMKIIHENPFCRDIAIWYDEFLMPGEDFKDEIKDALEKSEFLTLTVTPNLINENNYVLHTEYPLAKKMGKKILPVEMLATDSKILFDLYKGIPEIVGNEDHEKLKECLISLLSNIATRENDNDSQHIFLMGLAYLNGIDVEIDHKRALELILASAKAGCEDAIMKLVAMYNHGDGIKHDGQKAIEWQKKLVANRKKLDEEEPTEEHAIKYIQACIELSELCCEYSDLHFLQNGEFYLDIIYECRKYVKIYENAFFYAADCKANIYVGMLYLKCNDSENAEKYFQEAVLANTYCVMIGVLTSENDMVTEFDERMFLIYLNLAKLERNQGEYEKAEEYDKNAIEIAQKFADNRGTYQDLHNLSLGYARHGYTLLALEKLGEAEAFLVRSMEIDKKLVEEFRCLQYTSDLIFDYMDLAKIEKLRNNANLVENYYLHAFDLSREFVEQTDNPKEKKKLMHICNNIGKIYYEKNELTKAEDYYRLSFELMRQVSGKINMVNENIETMRILGDIELSKGNIAEFEKYYIGACEFLRLNCENGNESVELQRILVQCLIKLGVVLKNQKIYMKSVLLFLEATHISWHLVYKNEELRDMHDLYFGYKQMGECYLADNDVEQAEESYQKALEYKKRIVEISGHPDDKKELAELYYAIGEIYLNKNAECAIRNYVQARVIYEDVLAQKNDTEVFCRVGSCYRFLGLLYYQKQEINKSKESFEMAISILETLHCAHKDDIKIYQELGYTYFDFGYAEANKSDMEKALKIAEEIANRFPAVSFFRDDVEYTTKKIKEVFGTEEVKEEAIETVVEKQESKKKSFFNWFKKK